MTILDALARRSPRAEPMPRSELVERHAAHNYSPLPVVAASAEGAWITDVDGRRYLDCLAAYSAVNFGHRNPEITATAHAQLDTVTLVSRAFHSDKLGPFCAALARLCGKDMVLPMNSGAEAVESGLKSRPQVGRRRQGRSRRAGRTSSWPTTTSMAARSASSASPRTRRRGADSDRSRRDSARCRSAMPRRWPSAIDDNTVAVLLEPIQGEAGIVVPPDDYLPAVRALCSEHNVLMIADEIQSGLARTGYTFACDHWGVVPDVYLLGKALGGGVVPLSAVVADRGDPGRAASRRTRLDLRRQPAGRRDRHHGGLHAGARRIPGPLGRIGRAPASAAAGTDRRRRAGGARLRLVGRRGHRPDAGHRQGNEPAPGRPWCAGQGHPRFDAAVRAAAGDHRAGDRLGG